MNRQLAQNILDNALALLELGNIRDGSTLLKIVEDNTKSAEQLVRLAQAFVSVGLYKRAVNCLRKAFSEHSTGDPNVETVIALLQSAHGRPWGYYCMTVLQEFVDADTLSRIKLALGGTAEDTRDEPKKIACARPDGSLRLLGEKYKTDKSFRDQYHCYYGVTFLDIYEKYFAPIKDEKLNVLEIGVKEGASLRTWEEYFPNALVYGLDLDPECAKVATDRIKITIGNQRDTVILRELCEVSGGFDIIIDDGSHAVQHIIESFNFLFNYLRPEGLYVIEDLHVTYFDPKLHWPGMELNSAEAFRNKRSDFDSFLMSQLKAVDDPVLDRFALHYWHNTLVLIKTPARPVFQTMKMFC